MLKKILKKLADILDLTKHFDPETNKFNMAPDREKGEADAAPTKPATSGPD